MDNDKDFDYVPPTDLSLVLRCLLRKPRTTLKNMRGVSFNLTYHRTLVRFLKRYCALFVFFYFLFFADGFHLLFVNM